MTSAGAKHIILIELFYYEIHGLFCLDKRKTTIKAPYTKGYVYFNCGKVQAEVSQDCTLGSLLVPF
jgi:hypothetical protein